MITEAQLPPSCCL